jgi:mRNA-degrading endonuclease RelE of RelBE toxin-antitoxin system
MVSRKDRQKRRECDERRKTEKANEPTDLNTTTPRYKVRFTESGGNAYSEIDKGQQDKIDDWVQNRAPISPFGKPLTGVSPPTYSKRLGDIRIIYTINKKKLLVRIADVEWRKDVYGNL